MGEKKTLAFLTSECVYESLYSPSLDQVCSVCVIYTSLIYYSCQYGVVFFRVFACVFIFLKEKVFVLIFISIFCMGQRIFERIVE